MITMRHLSIIAASILISLLFVGCNNPKGNSQKNMEIIHSHFERLDKSCPIFIAEGMTVTSVTYSDEHKLITYNLRFSEMYDDSDIQGFKEYFISNTRYMALYQYTVFDADDENIALNNALIDEGFSYSWCFFKDDGSESGKYIDKGLVDSYDFANAKSFAQQHPSEARKEVLETIVKQYNENLPFEIDDGWELLSTYLYKDHFADSDTLIMFRLRIPKGYKVYEVRDVLQSSLRSELEENPFFENSVIIGHSLHTGVGFRVIKNDFTDSLLIQYPNYSIRRAADNLYEKKHRIYPN